MCVSKFIRFIRIYINLKFYKDMNVIIKVYKDINEILPNIFIFFHIMYIFWKENQVIKVYESPYI